jgi:antitoxin component YwqK of YwqJK toxin-antitoxin module
MKYLFLAILFLCFACNDVIDEGFTNKAEAKNLVVNGKKEGKWVEYTADDMGDSTSDSVNYFSYTLRVYKHGEPIGVERIYFKSGERQEIPHTNGGGNEVVKGFYKTGELKFEQPWENNKLSGVVKSYYKSGKLKSETPFKDGFESGVQKEYYESGTLKSETSYTTGEKKCYYENGKVMSETVPSNCGMQVVKQYDTTGNEIK